MTITRLPSHPLACQPGNECTVIRVRFFRLLFIGTLTRTDWQSHDMSCVFLWNVLCIFMECFCVTLGVHAHINLRLHFWTSPHKKNTSHTTHLSGVSLSPLQMAISTSLTMEIFLLTGVVAPITFVYAAATATHGHPKQLSSLHRRKKSRSWCPWLQVGEHEPYWYRDIVIPLKLSHPVSISR